MPLECLSKMAISTFRTLPSIEKHFRIRLRTLDALQLAVALALSHQGMIDHFVCADYRLCEMAIVEGLSVINPSGP